MVKNKEYKVITLCGSTRFKDAFMEVQKALTLKGYIVISVGLFGHSCDNEVWTEGTKEMLDNMHKRKIDMADEIFVVDVGGYIGTSTKSEIEYAKTLGKPVHYYTNQHLISLKENSSPIVESNVISHGYWMEKPHGACSVCGKSVYDIDADFWVSYVPPYCPNCGAKMDMKEN